MFDHEAKPFPSGYGRSVGGLTFSLEVIVGEPRENFHRFGVEAFDEGHHIFVAIRQFFAVRDVAAGPALDIFGPHVAFRYGEMPQQVAGREFSWRVAPINFVQRDAARHAHGAPTNISKIVQERLDGFDFHGDSHGRRAASEAYRMSWRAREAESVAPA